MQRGLRNVPSTIFGSILIHERSIGTYISQAIGSIAFLSHCYQSHYGNWSSLGIDVVVNVTAVYSKAISTNSSSNIATDYVHNVQVDRGHKSIIQAIPIFRTNWYSIVRCTKSQNAYNFKYENVREQLY